MCQNTTMRVNGAWIKRYCVLCSKIVITSLLVRDKPLEAPASVKRVYCLPFRLCKQTVKQSTILRLSGESESSTVLATWDGTKTNGEVQSSTNTVYIRFTSDFSVVRSGFRMTYNIAQSGELTISDWLTISPKRVHWLHLFEKVFKWYMYLMFPGIFISLQKKKKISPFMFSLGNITFVLDT